MIQGKTTAILREAAVSLGVAAAAAVVAYDYLLATLAWPVLKIAAVGIVAALSAAAAGVLMVSVVRPCLTALCRRQAILCTVLGLICGWGLVVVIPIMPPRETALAGNISAAVSMAFPLTVLCLWLVSRNPQGSRHPPSAVSSAPPAVGLLSEAGGFWRTALAECLLPWAYGLPLLLAGGGYLVVFQPALMSNDSLGQWWQMLSGGYTDVAPAFHTMTNWLITRIWFSPAAVAWTQLLAMSLVVACTLAHLRRWGLTRAWAWAASVLVAAMPAAGILSITLWKDIPYTIAFLVLALWVLEIIQSRGRWLAAFFRLPAGPGACACWPLSAQWSAGRAGNAAVVGTAVLSPRLAAGPLAGGCLCRAMGHARPALPGRRGAGGGVGDVPAGRRGPRAGFLQDRDCRQSHCRADGGRHAADGRRAGSRERALSAGRRQMAVWSTRRQPLWPGYAPALGTVAGERERPGSPGRPALPAEPDGERAACADVGFVSLADYRRAGLDNYYTVAFVPGKNVKYQRLRDFHVSGDANVDWAEPKVPLPGIVDWTFRNAWLFWRPALYLYLILFSLAIAMLREGSAWLAPFLDTDLAADRMPRTGGLDAGVPLPVSDLHDRAAVWRFFPVFATRPEGDA